MGTPKKAGKAVKPYVRVDWFLTNVLHVGNHAIAAFEQYGDDFKRAYDENTNGKGRWGFNPFGEALLNKKGAFTLDELKAMYQKALGGEKESKKKKRSFNKVVKEVVNEAVRYVEEELSSQTASISEDFEDEVEEVYLRMNKYKRDELHTLLKYCLVITPAKEEGPNKRTDAAQWYAESIYDNLNGTLEKVLTWPVVVKAIERLGYRVRKTVAPVSKVPATSAVPAIGSFER